MSSDLCDRLWSTWSMTRPSGTLNFSSTHSHWSVQTPEIIRQPDIVVGGLRFYRNSIYLLLVLLCQLPYDLSNRRNSTTTGNMLGSGCGLKMYFRNLRYLLPLKIGGPKTTFRRHCNLTANFVFKMKHDIHNQARGWKIQASHI